MRKIYLIIVTLTFLQSYFLISCNSVDKTTSVAITSDSVTIAKGEISFGEKCSSCHNFSQDGIGPQLGGITNTEPLSWLKNFISNPKKTIDAGDTTALKLLNQYKVLMPSFDHLNDEQLNELIAFIHTKKNA